MRSWKYATMFLLFRVLKDNLLYQGRVLNIDNYFCKLNCRVVLGLVVNGLKCKVHSNILPSLSVSTATSQL